MVERKEGILLLEDGRVFQGKSFGSVGTKVGEVVFNTSMTGYQEALTDPSYCEQILVMTTSHVGNTGVNREDVESRRCFVHGFIARHFSKNPSNHRSEQDLNTYLVQQKIPAIEDIDTRSLVRHLRDRGSMKGVISTDGTKIEALQKQLEAYPGMVNRDLATDVASQDVYVAHSPSKPRFRVNLIDGGCKTNIIRLLKKANCLVRVVPIHASLEEWQRDCDLIFLSNGPGDPASLQEPIQKIAALSGKIPMAGICLGHQLMCLALGAKSFKLPFGHRGSNHPTLEFERGIVEISSQNHGFCIEEESLKETGAEITHINLNDKTVAGFHHREKRMIGVQFHPEASPGPHDAQHLLTERFLSIIPK
jgi:carbamoyl-phosphate synthase small subunit